MQSVADRFFNSFTCMVRFFSVQLTHCNLTKSLQRPLNHASVIAEKRKSKKKLTHKIIKLKLDSQSLPKPYITYQLIVS
ncbi:hypothetical protein VIBNIWn13_150102 [Vibrio nigripulchritudo Wn13]|nr:hypothetical protein VIBNISFn135_1090103 [Vibrio nigripulchritudo SFn135]CCO51890.1 hypothetical protein VIBNIWn13_150102 [Vibrio nigripulchritudo Wn13]